MSDESTPVYVIVGASGGIGTALCDRLVPAGARLILVGRDADKLAEARNKRANGHPAGHDAVDACPADARDSGQVNQCFERALEKFGRVDGAVNLAGSILIKPGHLLTDEEWHETIRQNLDSAFFVQRAAVKAMMQNNTAGSIVLMSTVAAKYGLGNHEAIAAAKAGVQGLVIAAAASNANRGIRVNGVAPGLTNTPLAAKLTANEATLKASKAMHPLGRIGEPADIAATVHWLLSPESAFVTGQVISVDGGLSTVKSKTG